MQNVEWRIKNDFLDFYRLQNPLEPELSIGIL